MTQEFGSVPTPERPTLTDVRSWTDRLGRSRLKTFTEEDGRFWLEQNDNKRSRWGKLAREGHQVAWQFDKPGGSYTGNILVDGEIYSVSAATKKFLGSPAKT
jgi:hypothetical protein